MKWRKTMMKNGREAVNFLRACNWSAVVDKCNDLRKESFCGNVNSF